MGENSSSFDSMFVKFSKHIPRLLRKQLLSDIVNQLRTSKEDSDTPAVQDSDQSFVKSFVDVPIHIDTGPGTDRPPSVRPTIERFHGTLLFVDISGFTILSQKLKPEKLQQFINGYFKRLIDVVEKYGGDVVKFAGDALFIVWQTKVNSLDDPEFERRSAEALQSAVSCGMEINSTCSDYRVELTERQSSLHTAIIENIESSAAAYCDIRWSGPVAIRSDVDNNNINSSRSPSNIERNKTEQFAFLNVHSGVGVGVMAIIDVGFRDRWEQLLLGVPLQEVAVAESEAGKGELVISSEAHRLLQISVDSSFEDGEFECARLDSGYFKVLNFPKQKQSKISRMISTDEVEDEIAHESYVLREIDNELGFCVASFSFVADADQVESSPIAEEQFTPRSSSLLAKNIRLLEQSLLDDILRHVHSSPRGDYVFVNELRRLSAIFSTFSRNFKDQSDSSQNDRECSVAENDDIARLNFVRKVRTLVGSRNINFRQRQALSSPNLKEGKGMLAELRELIVMFINIKIPDAKIDLSSSGDETLYSTCQMNKFHFLKRTQQQLIKDNELLYSIQTCARTFTDAMKRHTGQLRQFIIDDKGCVAIGTWGLRGSMSNDLAAMALSSARDIIRELKALGVSAAIGVTSGKVYCGLVGSPTRHEFAVMGPSVNLSARLMGKAGWGEILCDASTRERDRTHMFAPFAKIVAKGYAEPVATFKPIFRDSSDALLNSPRADIPKSPRLDEDSSLTANPPFPVDTENNNFKLKNPVGNIAQTGGSTSKLASLVLAPSMIKKRLSRRVARRMSRFTSHMKSVIGRNAEIADILRGIAKSSASQCDGSAEDLMVNMAMIDSTAALCANNVASDPFASVGSSKLLQSSLSETGTSEFFNITTESNLVVVCGSSGMGKTVLTKYITQNLLRLSLANPSHWNLLMFSNSDRNSISFEPFSQWKQVFLSLLCDHYSFSTGAESSAVPQISSSAAEKRKLAVKGLALLKPSLPALAQSRLSLLECISSVFSCEDEGRVLKGVFRMEATSDLLVAILTAVRDLRRCVLFFYLENIHEMDRLSLYLINRLWNEENGFIFLLTSLAQVPKLSTVHSRRSLLLSSLDVRMGDSSLEVSVDHITKTLSEQALQVLNITRSSSAHRLVVIELQNLSSAATYELASSILRQYQFTEDMNVLLEKILTISGGNPLYASELAKALGQSYAQHSASFKSRDDLQRLVESLQVSRIEEVIQFRFDKFSSAVQVLLKMISVACANGARASLRLLAYMVEEMDFEELQDEFADCGTAEERMVRIVELADEVLQSETFLVLSERKRVFTEREEMELGAALDSFSSDSGEFDRLRVTVHNVENLTLNFDIELERASIYNIMLEEQTAAMHAKVAGFLDQLTPQIDRVHLQAHLCEEAFHWERGAAWTRALRCNFEAAMLLDGAGQFLDSRKYLLLAYRMFSKMRQATRLPCAMDADARDTNLLVRAMPALFQAHFDRLLFFVNADENEALSRVTSPTAPEQQHNHTNATPSQGGWRKKAIDKTALFLLFGGDTSLLHTVLSMLFRLAHSCYKLDVDTAVVSQLLEEAMEIIAVVKVRRDREERGAVDSTAVVAVDEQSPEPLIVVCENASDFYIRDPSVCLPILLNVLMLYHKQQLMDDAERTREASACELFLTLARSPAMLSLSNSRDASLSDSDSDSVSLSVADLHLANGLVLERHLLNAQGRLAEGMAAAAQAVSRYSFDKHHAASIAHYGTDYVPQGVAQTMQTALLMGDRALLVQYMYWLCPVLSRITHLQTLATLSIPLSLLMVTIGECNRALRVFHHYLHVEKEQDHVFSHFRFYNRLLWLSLLLEAKRCRKEGRDQELQMENCPFSQVLSERMENDVNEDEAIDGLLSTFLRKIIAKEFLVFPRTARRFAFLAVGFYGFPIEYACANVLLSLSRDKAPSEYVAADLDFTVADALSLAEEYLAYAEECVGEEHSCTFAHCLTLFARAEVEILRIRKDISANNAHVDLQLTLNSLRIRAERFPVPYVSQKIQQLEESLGAK